MKSVKISGRDINLRQVTYGEYDECLILSETLVEHPNANGVIVKNKTAKDSIYISESTKRMLCTKKPHEQGYHDELEQKTKWLNGLNKEDGIKIRQVVIEIMNAPGDVGKK